MWLIVCLLSGLLEFANSVNATGMYTVIAPGTLRSDYKYSVAVALHNADEPCTMDLALVRSSNKISMSKRVTVQPMSMETVVFEAQTLPDKTYTLNVTGVSGLIFEDSMHVSYGPYKPMILIQTDKAKYKPGDLVQFRVIILDKYTRPAKYEKPVRLIVLDGAKNQLKEWKDIELNNGVHSGEFQLSDEPVLGDWTLSVHVDWNVVEKKTFEVAKYVLPKFEVSIDTDKDVALADGGIKLTVRSKYTYGKPVKGQATVTVEPNYYYHLSNKSEKKLDVDGKGHVEFDFQKDLRLVSSTGFLPPLNIKVAMEEALTGAVQNTSTVVNLHHDRFKIEGLDVPDNYVENETLTYKVVIKNWRGAPVQDTKNPIKLLLKPPEKYFMRAIFDATPEPDSEKEPLEFVANLNEHGIATFEFSMPENPSDYYSVQCTYLEVNQHLASLYKYQPTRSSSGLLQMTVKPDKPQRDKKVSVEISSSEDIPYFMYVIVAKGNIVHAEYVPKPENPKSHTIEFMPTYEMIPHTAIYVHYVHNNELRFEETVINFDKTFENFIELSAPGLSKPGENVDIEVKTDANSYVGLLGVDQSVLLLKSGNDISKNDVFNEIDAFTTRTPWMRGYGRYPGEKSGLVTITNAHYPYNKDDIIRRGFVTYSTGQLFNTQAAIMPVALSTKTNIMPIEAPKLRSDFCETWIFHNISHENGQEGNFTLSKKIPDTITSWIITGFSVNNMTGLALTETPTKIRVFQPFFISTYLPYSVKRGEIIAIPVMVFNYMDKALDAEVTMDNTDREYEFVEMTNDVQEKYSDEVERVKRVTVPPNTGKALTYIIHPTKVGDVALKIKAITPLAGDAIRQMLKVEPEGVPQFGNKAIFVNLQDAAEQTTALVADIPIDGFIPDSEYIELSVVGDLLGPTFNNLDNLVRMPYGCGEQNMINFVPNILVMRYLSGLKKPAKQTKLMEQAVKYMEIGYQRELTYRHDDGSFSAFGKSSSKYGSTWLTAYVMRSFLQAKAYIEIHHQVHEIGMNYLMNAQNPNGSFVERGKLFDHAHQSEIGLTAFVILPFLEDEYQVRSYRWVVDKALKFLSENIDQCEDIYALAIAALAFQKTKHPMADKLLTRLEGMARQEKGFKWWSTKSTGEVTKSYFSSNNDVEITSYILLSHLEKNSFENSLPIIKWLIAQRNSNGGFSSTQDTVMGLEAIIRFVELTGTGDSALSIDFEVEGNETSKASVTVNADNSLLMQTHVLPKSARKVNLKARGSGVSMVQLAYRYNVADKPKAPSFKLDITVKEKQAGRLKLEVCSSYEPLLESSSDKSNMLVEEIALPSGYTVVREHLESLVKAVNLINRVEVKDADSKAIIYIESLKAGQQICFDVVAHRTHGVAKRKPTAVSIYDYYDSSKSATEYYEVESSLTDICNEINESECLN